MRYLLDTRPFLLWDADASQLPEHVLGIIQSADNEIYVSLASMREIQIKSQIGMLDLPASITEIFQQQQDENDIGLLPIGFNLTLMLTKLPNYHHDPFDRLIVAQALADDLTIITNDPLITQYEVKTCWR